MTPISLIRFAGRTYEEQMENFLLRGSTFIVNVIFLILLGAIGGRVVTPVTGGPAKGMFAFLDGVFGFV